MKKLSLLLLLCFTFSISIVVAQTTPLDVATKYINDNLDYYGLTQNDVSDFVVTDNYKSQHNGATHIYIRQRTNGIEVYNAIMSITLNKENKVVYIGNRFLKDVNTKTNGTMPSLTPIAAIKSAATQLGITTNGAFQILENRSPQEVLVSDGGISLEKIPVKLMYQPMDDGSVRLAWDLNIYTTDAQNWWSVRVDALTGDILNKNNWVVHCKFDKNHYTNVDRLARKNDHKSHKHIVGSAAPLKLDNATDHVKGLNSMGTYNVFAIPLESPMHGNRTIEVDPWDSTASQYGWHDTDGNPGADYTITRGNNVHAYLDTADQNASQNDEPDGGPNLIFDFPLDLTLEPEDYQEAAVTNLFYWNNMMHDVWFHYGFDEPSGNFQFRNYTSTGASGDQVRAEAQDGSGTNNANFATPPDGGNGRMQMYRWNNGSTDLVTVLNGSAAGGFEAAQAGFGPGLDTLPLTADLVIVDDGTFNGSQGCNSLTNGAALAGNIALIDRGSCEFGLKVLNAEQAGAIAAIVCNNQPTGLVNMGAGAVGGQVTIPSVFMTQADCQAIKVDLNNGMNVQVNLQVPVQTGAAFLDSDLDNGVIAHEYGHGISNRLTGGPSNTSCLSNTEQAGEGWSDWFALVMTVEPGDQGADKRGMGVYIDGQSLTGTGIRSTAYSTDFNINPKTMSSIVLESVPHGLGSVFASAIWDLYWTFTDTYGYDPDIYNGTGGNNIAMQLVMDGMKVQACNPSLIDSRDGILAADLLNYNGQYQCLIWEVFARRGFGFSADALNNNDRYDNVEAFDVPPSCFSDIVVTKTAPREAEAGTAITYTIDVENSTSDTLTNVTILDTLASNLTYSPNSSNCTALVNSGVVSINLGTMLPGETRSCSFDAIADFNPYTIVNFEDDIEDAATTNSNWLALSTLGNDNFTRVTSNSNSGAAAWYAPNSNTQSDFVLASANTFVVSGTNPALRFFHSYDISPGIDGGVVEISDDFTNWADIGQYAISGKYRGPLNTAGLTLAPGRSGFYGNSGGFVETIIDLSNFAGQTVYFRFRMTTDDNTSTNQGWYIDDISLIDLVITENKVNVTTAQGFDGFAEVAKGGTIITQSTVSTNPVLRSIDAYIYPNPAENIFNVKLSADYIGEVSVEVFSADGKLMRTKFIENKVNNDAIRVEVNGLAAGMYFVKVKTNTGMTTKRLVIQD